MGMFPKWPCDATKVNTGMSLSLMEPNPNAERFDIIKREVHNNATIILVKYHGCTTFNGSKLLLLRGEFDENKIIVRLDPHLLGNNHPVVARFEPTQIGLSMARSAAKHLSIDQLKVCENCKREVNISTDSGHEENCDFVWSKRGWRQLGAYDG
jgi:hypothetical protein